MTKSPIILTGMIVTSALVASLMIQHWSQRKIRENDAVLRQQDNQLSELAAENQRLTSLVDQTKTNSTTTDDRTAELAQLRAKAESLRQQTNQLAKQLAENRRSMGVQFFSRGDFNLEEHNNEIAITLGGTPRR